MQAQKAGDWPEMVQAVRVSIAEAAPWRASRPREAMPCLASERSPENSGASPQLASKSAAARAMRADLTGWFLKARAEARDQIAVGAGWVGWARGSPVISLECAHLAFGGIFIGVARDDVGVQGWLEIGERHVIDALRAGDVEQGVANAERVERVGDALGFAVIVRTCDDGIGEQQAIAFEGLHITNHGPAGGELCDHVGVGSSARHRNTLFDQVLHAGDI